MGLVFETRHHAKVPSAASERPEQVCVLVAARPHQSSIGGHDICAQQVVAREAVFSVQVTDATA
jgi:hypothetical protein